MCGLLLLSDEVKTHIWSSMKDLASLQKFQDIVVYQFKFGYDLASKWIEFVVEPWI